MVHKACGPLTPAAHRGRANGRGRRRKRAAQAANTASAQRGGAARAAKTTSAGGAARAAKTARARGTGQHERQRPQAHEGPSTRQQPRARRRAPASRGGQGVRKSEKVELAEGTFSESELRSARQCPSHSNHKLQAANRFNFQDAMKPTSAGNKCTRM
jgi:hypothetical protein